MTPSGLLSFWRERWHKARGPDLYQPYQGGPVVAWLDRARYSQFWALRGSVALALAGALLFLLLTPAVGLSLNGQILFSALLFVFAALIQRYDGPVCALALLGLSLMASSRYLTWRFMITLPTGGWDMVWGLWLGAAEALLWLAWMLRMAAQHWPFYRAPVALPQAAVQWPLVDVVLLSQDHSPEQLRSGLQALKALDWPVHKRTLHLAGPASRADLAELAQAEGVGWLVLEQTDALLQRRDWLAALEGELLLVLEEPGLPVDFLPSNAGSLVAPEGSLALLCTPCSIWAPASLAARRPLSPEASPLLLARRDALLELSPDMAPAATLVARLQAAGWRSAGAVVAAQPEVHEKELVHTAWWQVDTPNGHWVLGARLRARALLKALRFYAPVARMLGLVTPLLCLGLGLAPVRSDPSSLLAYGLPHLLLLRMAWQGQDRSGRLSMWRQLREWLLEGVMLWRTVRTYVQTQWRYLWGHLWPAQIPCLPDVALPRLVWWREGSLLAIHGLLLVQLLWHPPVAQVWRDTLFSVYAGWALYNVLASLARLALAKEEALVRRETAQRARQEVLLTLGPGRLQRARSDNFPSPLLCLQWMRSPAALSAVGEGVTLSVLHAGREYPFSAELRRVTDQTLELAIAPSELAEYQAFGTAVYSREANWPRWLPERRADQILPDWLHRLYGAAESLFYDFVIARKGLQSLLQKLQAWLRPGTQQHG